LGKAIGRQELALDAVEELGVDLVLAGHNHRASAHDASDLVTRAGGTLVVQAGTATSVRLRDEEQSFNRIEIEGDDVTLTVFGWANDRFEPQEAKRYRRRDGRWKAGVSEPVEQATH
jgi:predicted phosphodiesterase